MVKEKRLTVITTKYKKTLIALVFIVLLYMIGEITVGGFVSVHSIMQMIKFATYIALFALCQLLVICAGGDIDLSVGYVATLVAVLSAHILEGSNVQLWKGILIAVAVGGCIGLINGLLVSYVKLPSLVVTMGMANVAQGIVNVYSAKYGVGGSPSPILRTITTGSVGVVPNIIWLLLICTAIAMIIFYKTKIGVLLKSIGFNALASYRCGLKVKVIRTIAFVASGIIAGCIGLLLLGNLGQAFKDMASQYVMPSIAAVVVGGVSLNGGEGNYINVVLGAMVLQTLTNLFVSYGLGDAGKWLGIGAILLLMLIFYVREKMSR
ncbi:ABC transporter permease [Faecalicatena acetigenes]|uniref:Autoinducer 2 import system permease protein LsrD n=1 Tax=Faecalicatena acetigenes TaxID=2981790 RepID=A0ABT2TAJ6_9FIRM|nr:ABC transporter permease [Faecalicatena acetigenes]MCU6747300.1 ABC transporter permease [Faecalicatena acetigenes]SCH78504.1 Ribose transport system permease protein rbsC [uncultured Clostridium sp.]